MNQLLTCQQVTEANGALDKLSLDNHSSEMQKCILINVVGMVNSVENDQTAPLGAFGCGCPLFCSDLSQYLDFV